MGKSVIRTAGLVVVVIAIGIARGVVPNGNEPLSCLQARDSCHGNITCANLFDDMEDYCDNDIHTCKTLHREQCRTLLKSLHNNPYLGSCTCDEEAPNYKACLHIQNRIFLHACVRKDGSESQPWIRHTVPEKDAPSPEELEAIEQSLDKELSCIGVRQLCLKNIECHEAFKTFQDVCTMKKELGVCTAVDREACFRAIETIRPTGLFDCECKMGMKEYTLQRCERIQARLTHNYCLVSVPYFIHSSNPHELPYKDLVLEVNEAAKTSDPESTCIDAFEKCNDDINCRRRFANAINSCSWNKMTNACDRPACLEAIRAFYLLARPEKTHALLFCRCKEGDEACQSVRAALFPTCSVIEDPPPSCLDILQRCGQDEDCGTRWHSYVQLCSYDKTIEGCPATMNRCRKSQASIMGTILTTNCTCQHNTPKEQEKCLDARHQLQKSNLCREMAFDDFHTYHTTTPDTLWADDARGENMQIRKHTSMTDCLRELRHKVPSFMNVPKVIRRYNSADECSDVCQCRQNGTLVCTRLPCGPNLSCKTRTQQVFAHGSTFAHTSRGQCRCIRGEIVCALPESSPKLKAGFYLRVGYSVSDLYLVEENSAVEFSPRRVADKLGAILNADSAEQFCNLDLYRTLEANLVFEIRVSENSPSSKGCVIQAKMLDNKINDRDNVIANDAELSVIKVSELLRVVYINEQPTATHQSLTGDFGRGSSVAPTWLCLATSLVCILLVHVMCFDAPNAQSDKSRLVAVSHHNDTNSKNCQQFGYHWRDSTFSELSILSHS